MSNQFSEFDTTPTLTFGEPEVLPKEEVKVPTLQDITAQLIASGYANEDHFVVDVNENGLFVKKS